MAPLRRRGAALLALLALLLAACDGEDGGAARDPGDDPPQDGPTAVAQGDGADAPGDVRGGTAVWGFAQEPLTLNPTLEDGNVLATTQVALATVLPLWVITPDFRYEPTALLDRAEVVAAEDRFAVVYHLAEGAEWSDGTPVTAGDVFFTLQTCLDTRWAITSREACSAVDMAATEEGLEPASKVIEVVFAERHAAWQTLFSSADGVILPSHLLEGQDWSSAWDDDIPIASGPFRFESWDRGRRLTLVRNDGYAGEPALLDRLVLAFGDVDDLVAGMRAGDVDLLEPPPELEPVQQLEALEQVQLQTAEGPVWEQLGFHLDHDLLGELAVRRAVAAGVDRAALVDLLAAPIHAGAEPLGSLVSVRGQRRYADHFGTTHDPDAAVALLEDRGCRRGDDGIFACQGRRLAFELTTTAGDERRELAAELLRDQLADIGVELTPRYIPPSALFVVEGLADAAWEMSAFAWVAGADPGTNVELWTCDGARNFTGYCDEAVTELLEASTAELDPEERAALIDRAGRRLAEDVPALPLYQRPSVLAVDEAALTGPRLNPTQWGQVWNVGEWRAVAP